MSWIQAAATLVLALGMALFFILMDVLPKGPRHIRINGKELQMPDMRFHYNADTLYRIFDDVGAENLPRLRRYWLLDFGFIFCFLGVMLVIDLNYGKPATWLYLVMGIAAVLRAILDVTENLLLLRAYRAYPVRNDKLANLAGYVTSFKFLCLYAWVIMLFLKLFARAFGINWNL